MIQGTLFSCGDQREVRLNARVGCVLLGNKLRVVPISYVDNPHWFCAFPRLLRRAGDEFLVERLIAVRRYYRAGGAIEPIASAGQREASDAQASHL